MNQYRIYLLDHRGAISHGASAECSCDDDALAIARIMAGGGRRAEVWNKTRCVGAIDSHAE